MNENEQTRLKVEINNFIWMNAPGSWTLEKADEIAIKILSFFDGSFSPATEVAPIYSDEYVGALVAKELHERSLLMSPALVPFITKHLNIAFEKGRQIGRGEGDA